MLTAEIVVKIMNDLGFTEDSLTNVLAGVRLQMDLAALQSKLRNIVVESAAAQAATEAQRQELQAAINAKQTEIDALQS